MAAKQGKLQSSFNAGEIDPLIHERVELKYYSGGLRRAENIEITPQGGFRLRDGFRDRGALAADASRLFAFTSSQGEVYELVFRPGKFSAWGDAGLFADDVAIPEVSTTVLEQLTATQRFDTMFLFQSGMESQRIRHLGPTIWLVDALPYENIPNWDYGEDPDGDPYTNAVAAVWDIEFTGLTSGATVFTLTVTEQETLSLTYNSTMATLITLVKNAIEALPNVAAGITVTNPSGTVLRIAFTGAGNEGDAWAVTGRVVNKADAAITSAKFTVGVPPGEPIMSAPRGWPQCGTFYQQRLIIGGFRAAPNVWAASGAGDYFNFDDTNANANGGFVVPMDSAAGEAIEQIIDNRYLLILTSKAEYWIAERAISRSAPPNHVQASTKGTKRGLPVAINEGAAIYVLPSGNVLDELRYTDVEGNYVSLDLSLIASHLVTDVRDLAQRPSELSTDGNHVVLIKGDGTGLLGTFLRDQDPPVTAFARLTTDGLLKAVCRNGSNQLTYIAERASGRRLERFEDGLLLDEAESFAFGAPETVLTGLDRFNGREIWALADNDVFGPFTVISGTVTLPRASSAVTVGSWRPPVVETLPPDRTIGPGGLIKKGKARIHSVTLSLIDTTSVAISTNGRPLQDVSLRRFGALEGIPELEAGFTGEITINGLTGWADEPFITVSQLRPGRLTVRSITTHARV
jgi:hypothetical protein